MRASIFSLLGGIRAIALVGRVAVGARGRASGGRSARRAELLRQLDEYDAWWNLKRFGHDNYAAARRRFLTQHPELARYHAWWVARRRQEPARTAIDDIITTLARPASLRVPRWLERYLARTGD